MKILPLFLLLLVGCEVRMDYSSKPSEDTSLYEAVENTEVQYKAPIKSGEILYLRGSMKEVEIVLYEPIYPTAKVYLPYYNLFHNLPLEGLLFKRDGKYYSVEDGTEYMEPVDE